MGKIVAGVSLLVLSFGIASADEYIARITSVDGKKITAKVFKKGGKGGGFKDAESKTLTVTSDAKIMKRQYDKDTGEAVDPVAVEDGLKNKLFTNASEDAPLNARITTNEDGKVTEITVGGRGWGGKGGGGFDFKKKKKSNDTSAD